MRIGFKLNEPPSVSNCRLRPIHPPRKHFKLQPPYHHAGSPTEYDAIFGSRRLAHLFKTLC